MRKRFLPHAQQALALLFLLPALLLTSCQDECESTLTYTDFTPVYMTTAEVRNAVKATPARLLQDPGKIYAKGNYLFINEVNEGIHIINNANPAAPQVLSFIEIPGNVDMAVKGNILYADSYMDLLAFDITDPLQVQVVNRLENVLPVNGMMLPQDAVTFLGRFDERLVTVPNTSGCNSGALPQGVQWNDTRGGFVNFASAGGTIANSGGAGKGGSMARFTITGNHLYTVGIGDLQVINISNTTSPQKGQRIPLGWGIETIFPYENKLFIGSTTGMHIYDNSNPSAPVHLSTYAHVRSCDPVVVEGDLAWVTLRSGNACAGFTNQLEVINISNPSNPKLLKTYPMQNPHGLGIDRATLFLCEGQYGLKVFDVKDHLKVDSNLKEHFKNIDAYDVIPLGNTLLMIGKDGLYQYDYSNLKQIKLISKIPVSRKVS